MCETTVHPVTAKELALPDNISLLNASILVYVFSIHFKA